MGNSPELCDSGPVALTFLGVLTGYCRAPRVDSAMISCSHERAHGASSHAPRLQPPSSTPLRSGGLPLWATAPSPEPGPRGRTKPRPATPAPKPRLTSPSAFQQNTSQVKVYSSRRQESHVQRRRVTGAGAGARGCGPHHPPVSRKSPARDESSFGCVVQTRQFLFVFSLRCVGFSRSSVLKFPFKGSW